MRSRACALGFVLCVQLVSPAAAGPEVVARASDPEDVKGRLDIVRTRFRSSGGRVTLTVETAEKWRCRYVKDDNTTADGAAQVYDDGKGIFFFWEFNTNRDSQIERDAFYRCKDGQLHFVSDKLHRSVRARKPGPRIVRVTLSRKKWRLGSRRLKLRAISQVNGTDGDEVFLEERDETKVLRPYRRLP